jgi:hypothetical protein
LFEEETIEAAMGVLRGWIERYGIPKALYCDHKNCYVIDRELPKINTEFAIAPKETADSHIPLMGIDLSEIFVYRYSRVVANDYVARFETRQFQRLNTNKERPRAKDNVSVHKKPDGEIKIIWKNKPLKTREIITEEVKNPALLTA